ncbi:hypothetical protein KIN20_004837 [Parelaphostrongylus tenuis]|uniref:Regulator of microtubule dynamics protein 1 n=1 Tax=Parelaphostrongylus tenuis TaxID=148309 RepID=A0AAD5MKD7_PARTN|nr:hypothetical protein KIN20_004837 [Parelaphostrongylus tenuis]
METTIKQFAVVEIGGGNDIGSSESISDPAILKRSPSPTERLGWLYRAALTCYNEGCSEDIESNRLHWLRKARDYALEAHELEPTDVEVLSLLCSSTGKLAEDSSSLDKVKYGFEFQKYLDRAIALRADSYEFLHMRGRFQYQVLFQSN